MKYGFDLDGTLDRVRVRDLARILNDAGHEVHIITGIFSEADEASGPWQNEGPKTEKIKRLFGERGPAEGVHIHFLHAMPVSYGRDYRLADLGLRKGALCEKLGIQVMFDDSETYCGIMKAMSGDLVVCHVR